MPGTTDAALEPATFPRMVLWLLAALAAMNLGSQLLAMHGPDEANDATPSVLRVAAVVLGMMAYVALLPVLGFIATSTIAIGGGAWLVGYRRAVPLVLTAALLPSGTWYAFRYGMKVILPEASIW